MISTVSMCLIAVGVVWVLLLHPDNPRDVGSVTQCAGVTAGGIHLHQAD